MTEGFSSSHRSVGATSKEVETASRGPLGGTASERLTPLSGYEQTTSQDVSSKQVAETTLRGVVTAVAAGTIPNGVNSAAPAAEVSAMQSTQSGATSSEVGTRAGSLVSGATSSEVGAGNVA